MAHAQRLSGSVGRGIGLDGAAQIRLLPRLVGGDRLLPLSALQLRAFERLLSRQLHRLVVQTLRVVLRTPQSWRVLIILVIQLLVLSPHVHVHTPSCRPLLAPTRPLLGRPVHRDLLILHTLV